MDNNELFKVISELIERLEQTEQEVFRLKKQNNLFRQILEEMVINDEKILDVEIKQDEVNSKLIDVFWQIDDLTERIKKLEIK